MIGRRCARARLAGAIAGFSVLATMAASTPGQALALDGLDVPASVRLQPEGVELTLQGGFVRTYFWRKTTSYALYTAERAHNFEQLVAHPAPKRMVVTVLMPEFTQEQFRSSWRQQFAATLGEDPLRAHAGHLERFLAAFETLRRGEQVVFDVVPGSGLRITLRGAVRATITDDAFATALLSVWLGPRSVEPQLARAMFAGS